MEIKILKVDEKDIKEDLNANDILVQDIKHSHYFIRKSDNVKFYVQNLNDLYANINILIL